MKTGRPKGSKNITKSTEQKQYDRIVRIVNRLLKQIDTFSKLSIADLKQLQAEDFKIFNKKVETLKPLLNKVIADSRKFRENEEEQICIILNE